MKSCDVLNDFTIKTVKEIIENAEGIFPEHAGGILQTICFEVLLKLETEPDDVQGIRKLIHAYEKLSPKDRQIVSDSVERVYVRRKTLKETGGSIRKVFQYPPEGKGKLKRALLGAIDNLPLSKAKKPPSVIKRIRTDLSRDIYRFCIEWCNLTPTQTKNGPFWNIMKEIYADPKFEKFNVDDIEAEIKTAKKWYKNLNEKH
jgi:hypothetical protein